MKKDENSYHKRLRRYFAHASKQPHFFPTHLSMLIALVHCCNHNDPTLPFNVNRKMLMRFSRIKSVSTYHKNIRELKEGGFIRYKPSWHPKLGSEVELNIGLEKNF
ncbi:hypothetical protein [Pedobacter sp. Leaf170]|uniref:hypothetical protein n=1 Tax=Pedobacter sp. Leaf170 TaxID=2876558 RepID=UPI001E3CF469|nr:hypothetical protein [Pedobacter sp. Leaf170]